MDSVTKFLNNQWISGVCASLIAAAIVSLLSRKFLGKKASDTGYSIYCLFLGMMGFISVAFIFILSSDVFKSQTLKMESEGFFAFVKIYMSLFFPIILGVVFVTLFIIYKDFSVRSLDSIDKMVKGNTDIIKKSLNKQKDASKGN
ncbi:hypothetical protein [Pseudobacteroides cellulosolvens]|uniref:Uncharacterized protein n=1 Tax=Pseudobacteroides cellulosolvens ATCC 35603 = DSM 2933 TaxID=398512 RepID=A0A0L6JG64_9FIRM|nr:hypothetical protein [Pseudobacteroides cellulosolvens]KNY24856.1 hypothetical protein Bccel_0113 [Pseudobacteroides cellulosolvens ATCC 35603 = DSM 2933]